MAKITITVLKDNGSVESTATLELTSDKILPFLARLQRRKNPATSAKVVASILLAAFVPRQYKPRKKLPRWSKNK